MSQEPKHKMLRQARVLTFALIAATMLAVIAITMAWLYQNKGLQTMTRIQVPYLYLRGHESDTISVELGEIDVREEGHKNIPFRVEASKDAKFKLQLGYTTNLPLNYTIVEVKNFDNWEGTTANSGNVVTGNYLNKSKNDRTADDTEHETTYGTYASDNVQTNAEPVYWQSNLIDYGRVQDKKYILIVSWNKCDDTVTDKDTDMIYLTAGISNKGGQDEANE